LDDSDERIRVCATIECGKLQNRIEKKKKERNDVVILESTTDTN
jgi:hypothetical protein